MRDHVRVHDPTTTRSQVDIRDSWYHQKPYKWIWAITWGHVGIWGSCYKGRIYRAERLALPQVPWWHLGWPAAGGQVCGPTVGSVLMPMAHNTIENHDDVRGLGHHLGPSWCLSITLPLEPYQSEWPSLPPSSRVTTKPEPCWFQGPCHHQGQAYLSGLCCHLEPWCYLSQGCCWEPRPTLPMPSCPKLWHKSNLLHIPASPLFCSLWAATHLRMALHLQNPYFIIYLYAYYIHMSVLWIYFLYNMISIEYISNIF